MLIGISSDGQTVYAHRAVKSESYFCPTCRSPLILKQGQIKCPHFAHYRQNECRAFSEGESEAHLLGKGILFQWLSHFYDDVVLEAYLPDLNQRPDLMFTDHNKQPVCLEFQCSPLAEAEMVKRSQAYLNRGFKVWWVLGPPLHIRKNKLSQLQKLFTYACHGQFCIFQLHLDSMRLEVVRHIQSVSPARMSWKSDSFFLDEVSPSSLNGILQQITFKKASGRYNLYQIHLNCMQACRMKKGHMRGLIEKLYKQGLTLQTCPSLIYYTVAAEWMIETPAMEWKFDLICCLLKQPIGSWFTREDYLLFCRSIGVRFYSLPLISEELKYLAFLQFLQLFIDKKIISGPPHGPYQLLAHPKIYKNEQHKLKCLKDL